jgi:hypothetical protein
MTARLALAAVAVAAIAFGIVRLDGTRACQRAQDDPVRSVRALLDDCHGALPLATGSVALLRAGRPEDAARLADAAVRRQPDDYVSWLAVAAVRAARRDAAGATRARERARELNPLAAALRRR